MSAMKEPEPIEYMQVTLKIPKACLMYLNEYVKDPDAWLENRLIEAVLNVDPPLVFHFTTGVPDKAELDEMSA